MQFFLVSHSYRILSTLTSMKSSSTLALKYLSSPLYPSTSSLINSFGMVIGWFLCFKSIFFMYHFHISRSLSHQIQFETCMDALSYRVAKVVEQFFFWTSVLLHHRICFWCMPPYSTHFKKYSFTLSQRICNSFSHVFYHNEEFILMVAFFPTYFTPKLFVLFLTCY